MYRPRSSVPAFGVFVLTLLLLVACSGAAEQTLIRQFFNASRLRDNTSLDNLSTVIFDPRTQGTVTTFTIQNIGPEQSKPLALKSLAKAHEDAKAEDTAFSQRKGEYQNANLEAIQRVLKAERDNAKISGKDADVQDAWRKLRDESATVSKKVSDMRRSLRTETQLVDLSVNAGGRTAIDVTKYDGEMITKEVTVAAPVRLPSGETAQKTYVITMQRALLKGEKEVAGRWIITGCRDAAASPADKTS
jgi:hypothetical protein